MSTPVLERPRVKAALAAAHRAGARVAHHAKGAKASGKAALGGAAAGIVIDTIENQIPMLREHWYIAPLVGVVAGHMLTKKQPEAGYGAIGASTAMLIAGYREKQLANPATAPAASGLPNAGRIANRVFNPPRASGFPNAGRVANRERQAA